MAKPTVQVTHPDKVMFPVAGFTKGQVVDYYRAVAPFILPHLKNRPLTLKLYPNGVVGKHIYLKDAPSHTPDWVKTFAVERKDKSKGDSQIDFVLVNDLRTLLWAANLSSLEMHTFLAKTPLVHRPTSIVFDLDPGEPAGVLECAEVALRLKDLLSSLGLESFVKASGSKGLQVYVPLNTAVTYEATEPFSQSVAQHLEQQSPKLILSKMAKSLRRGKVFIDWSQNVYFKTTVCVYSLRAKSDRPYISLPFTWKEVAAICKAGQKDKFYFSPGEALKRLAKIGDLFKPVLTLKQKLPSKTDRPTQEDRARQKKTPPRGSVKIPRSLQRDLSDLPLAKPEFVQPMQPEIVKQLPTGPNWQYELKWDGYRAIAIKKGQDVSLYSRNRNLLTRRYPTVVQQLRELPSDDAVLDGELVVFDEEGRPSFQLLQNYSSKAGHPLAFVAFDVLNIENHSTL